jgi:polyphosphate kinase
MAKEDKDAARSQAAGESTDLGEARLVVNRELSWLQFNWRVLEEAMDESHPLLERVKFLAIFASNLDEFFMIRVSGLRHQLSAETVDTPPDGLTPAEQLAEIRRQLLPKLAQQTSCWRQDLAPKLQQAGIRVLRYAQLKSKQRKLLRKHFEREIFPVLTPLAFDPSHPFPHISNLSMNLAVAVNSPESGERMARLKLPDVFARLLRIPSEETADEYEYLGLKEVASDHFVWMEDVVAANLDLLFTGLEVVGAYPFRVTRDADIELKEDEAADLLSSIEESVGMRHFGSAIRLEVDASLPERIRHVLIKHLNLAPYQVYTIDGRLGLDDLMGLTQIDRPDLKDPPFVPAIPRSMVIADSVFSVVRQRDLLLYHPYDSFAPVVDFVREAAEDPGVLAIKQTFYRAGANSPIVDALMRARENGKQVAALVELKARFDEENNIVWARALESAGVHVVYGLRGLKTHSKICLVVRRERDGIARYVHMSTGNYNAVTARIYADIGFFTGDPDIGADASELFNALTGYSRQEKYRKLLVAPNLMRQEVLNRVQREIERHKQHGDGYLAFKMNALVDKACIQALYRASRAGVKIDLQVRSICCLRPGLPHLSETITVTSIVGRFLEHARIYYFRNGGNDEILMGSADLMPRNLDRRVEILYPVEDASLREALRRDILCVHLRDSVKARRMRPDGSYERVVAGPDNPRLNSQEWLIEHRGAWNRED